MTPVEFYAARLDEMEAVARAATCLLWDTGRAGGIVSEWADQSAIAHVAANAPAYVLADIAAKRAVLARAASWIARDSGPTTPQRALRLAGEDVVLALIQPFADHPDFDESWRL